MTVEQYQAALADLRVGKIDQLTVANEDFTNFRTAWLQEEDKAQFVAQAQTFGNLIYRYQKD